MGLCPGAKGQGRLLRDRESRGARWKREKGTTSEENGIGKTVEGQAACFSPRGLTGSP